MSAVITDYEVIKVTSDEDGEVISVVVADAIGPMVSLFGSVPATRELVGREASFRRCGEGQENTLEIVRINRLLETAVRAASVRPTPDSDSDDPRHIFGPMDFYPYLL